MTTEEKRRVIEVFCKSLDECEQCPLYEFGGHCYSKLKATDNEVERNYNHLIYSDDKFFELSPLPPLPLCKVGDTVFEIGGSRDYEIVESEIKNIIYDTGGIAFDGSAIGKSVFITREDAEKALKERINDA